MDSFPIMPVIVMVLALVAAAIAAFRYPNGPRTDRPKSTLARDGGQGGIGYLLPEDELKRVNEMRAGRRR